MARIGARTASGLSTWTLCPAPSTVMCCAPGTRATSFFCIARPTSSSLAWLSGLKTGGRPLPRDADVMTTSGTRGRGRLSWSCSAVSAM